MKCFYRGQEITEEKARALEAAGQAHVVYGSSGGDAPKGVLQREWSVEPWMELE